MNDLASRGGRTTREMAASTGPIRLTIRGRAFTPRQLSLIVEITDRHFADNRTELSQRICRRLAWRQKNGRLKEVACREVLRRLEQLRLISLPKPMAVGARWNAATAATLSNVDDRSPVTAVEAAALTLNIVSTPADAALWNALVTRYHYLHSSRIVGRQLKYLVLCRDRPIACLGWGDASWEVRARDEWIGWNRWQRSRTRTHVVANVRFLILPWVRVPNLASRILGMAVRRIGLDWGARYGFQPALLETFVDVARFRGTCYRAANWVPIGATSGYAKVGQTHHNSQRPKAVFLYPLRKDFRQVLCRLR